MKFMYSILVSCLLFIEQAQAVNLNLLDATSFDPQPVVVSAADNSVPVGTVIIWTKVQIPEGWLECNGQAVPSYYPELRKMMKFTPNFQGMFLRGAGSQVVNHGSYGYVNHGTTLGAIQGDTTRDWFFYQMNPGGYGSYEGIAMPLTERESGPDGGGGSWNRAIYRPSRSVPTSTENRPVNVGVKYIIKAA